MTWDHPPVGRNRPSDWVQLRRLPAGTAWRIVATSTRFACRHQHWSGERTLPCLRPESVCPWCERGEGKWFSAFLGCYNLTLQVPMVLSIPEDAYRATEAIVGTDMLGGLRGWRIEFSRPAGGKRGRVLVESLGREPDPAAIPEPLHVPHILYRCWGMPRMPYQKAAEGAGRTSVVL